jgi:hypothetical protein
MVAAVRRSLLLGLTAGHASFYDRVGNQKPPGRWAAREKNWRGGGSIMGVRRALIEGLWPLCFGIVCAVAGPGGVARRPRDNQLRFWRTQ